MPDAARETDVPKRPMRERVIRFHGETGRVFDLLAAEYLDGRLTLAIVAAPSPRPDQIEAAG